MHFLNVSKKADSLVSLFYSFQNLPQLYIQKRPGAQSEGRGLIHKKGYTKDFKEDIALNDIFQIEKRKKYYRNFPDFVTLKFNDDYKQILQAEQGSFIHLRKD